ncbi:toxin-antitoxin system HicB family antitoxin [Gloeocapsa sp. PCC 73106]|uniref:toxin-antitoxin system HicB family antitoxin n=1 Tax=Gloeocapsa sp. PCC 73106 TaxID=102232 RepID=UPI000552A743|nr:toxin-antitoxin system HicB family antitoxin [Gloeocapsa sp. PCC 73106]
MSQLTVRLPDSLHQQLLALAKKEGVSLNQCIVYILTRQVGSNYAFQAGLDPYVQDVQEQSQAFDQLVTNLGVATPDQIAEVLSGREIVEPESVLTADILKKMQEKLRWTS